MSLPFLKLINTKEQMTDFFVLQAKKVDFDFLDYLTFEIQCTKINVLNVDVRLYTAQNGDFRKNCSTLVNGCCFFFASVKSDDKKSIILILKNT